MSTISDCDANESWLFLCWFVPFVFQIKEIKETNLSANQDKWEMRRLKWNVEGENGEEPSPIRGDPVSNSTLIVELGPMEIRTFLLKF